MMCPKIPSSSSSLQAWYLPSCPSSHTCIKFVAADPRVADGVMVINTFLNEPDSTNLDSRPVDLS